MPTVHDDEGFASGACEVSPSNLQDDQDVAVCHYCAATGSGYGHLTHRMSASQRGLVEPDRQQAERRANSEVAQRAADAFFE